jgi:soluble lytic murein transglycosylase-like protein
MAVRTKSSARKPRAAKSSAPIALRLGGWALRRYGRYIPRLIVIVVATVLLVRAVNVLPRWIDRLMPGHGPIAPLFTEEVRYWARDIERWAAEYDLDPNLLATVMQIESCGHPDISSYAGAQGLFQVMPFHFSAGEIQTDPETNAKRGASFLEQCLTNWGRNDPGLALACYNGGPSLTNKPYTAWPNQTQRYYIWGLGIYTDASSNESSSPTLDLWLQSGGATLCQMADNVLGL